MGQEAFKNQPFDEPEPREADIHPIKPVNPMWAKHAKFMANEAGIILSPKTITIYGILRDEKPDSEKKENRSGTSDQELLAEALRMSGDMSTFTTFTEKYPHIFEKKT